MIRSLALSLAIFLSWVMTCSADLVVQLDGSVPYLPGGISDPFSVSVFDSSPTSEDRLLGWQLRFQIVRQGGATGTVSFADPQLPSSDYLLDGVNFGISRVFASNNFANDEILIFDFDSRPATTGVVVPGSVSRLVDLRLQASSDANGVFELRAVGGAGNSEFTGSNLQATEFDNLAAGTNLGLANVTAIPEPGSLTVLLSVAAVFSLRRRRWV